MKQRVRLMMAVWAVGLTSAALAQAQVAEVSLSWDAIQVRVPSGKPAVLSVGADTGFRHEALVPAGETVRVPLVDANQKSLGDGFYTWEVRLLSAEADVPKASASVGSRSLVESGSFRLKNGRIEVVGEHRSEAGLGLAGGNPFDGPGPETVFTDNISARAACFSSDANCADPEPLGIIDVKLKGNIPLIRWERTGAGDKTWDIDVDLGGFRIAQVTDGRAPFLIADAAPTNSVRVDGFGRVGFGTSLPGENLHVVDSSDSSLRLQVGGQAWDLFTGSGSTALRVFNATGGGIPLVITTTGDVGIGASSPLGHLHVRGAGVQLSIFQSSNNDAVQFRLQTDSTNRRFVALNSAGAQQSQIVFGDSGAFDFLGATVNDRRLSIPAGGVLNCSAGVRTDANGVLSCITSTRETKNVEGDLPPAAALNNVMALRPQVGSYKETPDEPEHWLIAEDVAAVDPALVGTRNGKPYTVKTQNVIADLIAVIQHQQRGMEEQQRRIEALEQRITR